MLVFKAWRKSPALTQETTPSQRRITRILSDAQQAAAREFGEQRARVAELLSRGQVDRVVAMLPTEPWLVAQEALAAELLGELLDAGSRVSLPSIEKATLQFAFDRERPESSSWARQEAGNLITEINNNQRQVVREVVASSALGQGDWDDVAREVQGSIGLTTQQAGWVSNYYERAFAQQIRSGASSSQAAARAREQAARYQTSVHRYRANTIARTETMRAASEGRMQAWNQGITDGFISPLWEKEWVAEADACEICIGLGGTRVGVKQQFPVGEPPAHPNCRCDVILVPPKSQPAGSGGLGAGGLTGIIPLFPWEELAFEFLPMPSLDELRQWRDAYRIATEEGRVPTPDEDVNAFRDWLYEFIEPETDAYASTGDYPPEISSDDDNIEGILPDNIDVDNLSGDVLSEADVDAEYRGWRMPWNDELYNDAVDALEGYQWRDFLPINDILRSGVEDVGSWFKNIQLIDYLFDVAPAIRPGGEYFRTLDAKFLAGLKRGDTFIDNGYMSTSVSRAAAEEFGEDSGYGGKMRIIDAAGARKIYVERISTQDGFDQGEILFFRGTPLKYVGKDKDGWDVFVTASYKVEPPNRFARPAPPVNPALQFRDDADFLDFEDMDQAAWEKYVYLPERFRDGDVYGDLGWYMVDGYEPINNYMLTGETYDDEDHMYDPDLIKLAARRIAELLGKVPGLSRDLRVWRGINNIDYLTDLEPGTIFVHENFMSTSALKEVTYEFVAQLDLFETRDDYAILRINAPKGSKAILMPGSLEMEVLFAPGTKLKIIKVAKEMLPVSAFSDKLFPVTVIYAEIVL